MTTLIALLRGINVGGNRKIPMADLRAVCGEIGFTNVASYIQSGNLVFTTSGSTRAAEAKLERAIEKRFGFAVDVLVRTTSQWAAHAAGNPFLAACREEANRVLLLLSKSEPNADAVPVLRLRAKAGERIEAAGGAIWIHFPSGAGTSKLPSLLDRVIGSAVTARNWRTVQQIAELAAGG